MQNATRCGSVRPCSTVERTRSWHSVPFEHRPPAIGLPMNPRRSPFSLSASSSRPAPQRGLGSTLGSGEYVIDPRARQARAEASRLAPVESSFAEAHDAAPSPFSVARHDGNRIPLRRTAHVETLDGALVMTTVEVSASGARLATSSTATLEGAVTVHIEVGAVRVAWEGRIAEVEPTNQGELRSVFVHWTASAETNEREFSRLLAALY